ncbi:unnamed protein product, partial [Tetraodon nigroviridis]
MKSSINDGADFKAVADAMKVIGFTGDEIQTVYKILATILHLGNLTFGVDGDVTLIENKKLVSVMRELLSTKEENVEKALLYRTVATGRDVIEKQHTAQEASYGRDALAKAMYERLFCWIVGRICWALAQVAPQTRDPLVLVHSGSCVLSLQLSPTDKSLEFDRDFRLRHYAGDVVSNHIIKFANDTTVVGLISKNDESAYRDEVQQLTAWCEANNLSLNVDKTKEMIVDFRRAPGEHPPLTINGSSVEIVKNTKFLGVHLEENLTWSLNTTKISRKAQQRLYFLRRLRKAHLPPPILTTFYRGTIESILSSCITVWFGNCTVADRKTLQRIVRTAEKIIGVSLTPLVDIYTTRCTPNQQHRFGDVYRSVLCLQVWRGTIARMRYRRMRAALLILRAYRCYKVKSYIREVNRRFRNVRSMKDHGRQVKWPTPPKVLRKFEEALRSIYSRWWAWTLIKGLTPEEALKVRAKVASLEALKGQRADLGLHRTWEGNYLQKRDSPDTASSLALLTSELQRKDKFMRVLFSCNVRKINRFHKSEDRAVLITDRHLYKLDPLKQYKPMKSLPLYNV